MAYLAAHTSAGIRKRVNEDACCLEVAQTPLGEVLMAIVCDGVGGLAKGDIASSTVINRFVTWFEGELAVLMEGMVDKSRFDFALVQAVWGTHLQTMNELIRNYGAKIGARLGTTFTGVIACDGHYLIAHVGDCRAFRMNASAFEQITEDQTLIAKRLAAGEITEEEARHQPKNVILQSVGTERVVRPVFYEGSFDAGDLFVICCDGAYHRAENEGIRKLFQHLDYRDEAAMQEACETLLQYDMDCGEKDNLTVICFSGDLAGVGEVAAIPATVTPSATVKPAPAVTEDDLATMVESEEDDDLVTMVQSDVDEDEDDLATMVESGEDEDELATMVESDEDSDEDDLATMVESDEDSDEDDLSTMVESDEDDLATMVESDEDSDEDDLATMVGSDEDSDEDDLATMVESDEDEDDLATMVEDDEDGFFDDDDFGLPTFDDDEDEDDSDEDEPVWADDTEDDAPTLVESDGDEDDAPTMVADEDDDLPTMVEGADA